MIMKIYISIILAFFLFGCAGATDPYKAAAAKEAAKTADAALDDANYYRCVVASIGSITREYGDSAEEWELYIRGCEKSHGAMRQLTQ